MASINPVHLPATLLPQPLPKPFHFTCSLPPPSSREEAISQAKSCLSSSLQKPLNNPSLLTRKLRNPQRQPRFRVEIPVADDVSLSADLFSDLPITKKGSAPNIILFWPSLDLAESARRQFTSARSVIHSDIASASLAGDEISSFADLAVFLAPEASILEEVRVLANCLSPKSVVLFNPKWAFEEEKGFDSHIGSFVGSFDVIYSFMGLEVRGLLSRRNGVLFRVVGGEGWLVMVEDDGKKEKKKGELQVVSKFKRRPEIGEVENVLYNLMAANSPVTNAIRFFRDLASRKKID